MAETASACRSPVALSPTLPLSTRATAPAQLGKRPNPPHSPDLVQTDPDQSPRLNRSKRIHPTASVEREATTAVPDGRGMVTTATQVVLHGGVADRGMAGLGVGLVPSGLNGLGVESPHGQIALSQTAKLNEMPVELSAALSRLSSQHHLSEYNTLKRVVVTANAAPTPIPAPAPIHHLPTPVNAPVLHRSASSPAVPAPPSSASHVPTRSNSTTNPASILKTFFQPSTPASTRSMPNSRVSTPPPRISVLPSQSQTGLTPTLVSFSFSETPASDDVMADALGDALRSDMRSQGLEETNVITSAKVVPIVVPTAKRNIVQRQVAVAAAPLPDKTPMQPGMQIINGVAVKTSASHPMNISPILPPEMLVNFAADIHTHTFPSLRSSQSPPKSRSPLMPSSSFPTNNATPQPFFLSSPSTCNLWALTTPAYSLAVPPLAAESISRFAENTKPLGNFFLSSCPGKKVRLTGGSNANRGGRNPICRDLGMDMRRAKDEGVRLIVCCLDDQELSYLGAPWEEYEQTATSLSIAVIRIPMVEGFAPPSPAALDAHLTRIYKAHTLRGESVLAHCRGGIGRAGLVACCWMIKGGFVGGLEDVDAMTVVKRVIEVVRKRRSVKSIETPQQVHFLLEYAEYLKSQAVPLPAAEILL